VTWFFKAGYPSKYSTVEDLKELFKKNEYVAVRYAPAIVYQEPMATL